MALNPTEARLALLFAVSCGEVYRCRDFDSGNKVAYWDRPGNTQLLVTKRINEQVDAGWLREGPASGPSWYARRPMLLTDEGRAVLFAANRLGSE